MNHHEEIETLRAEIRDIRNDAVGPTDRLAAEVTELRKLLRRTYWHFTAKQEALKERIDTMALKLDTLQANLATLKTDVDALIASHGTTEAQAQAVIDDAATQIAAVDATVKAGTAPVEPPATVPGT